MQNRQPDFFLGSSEHRGDWAKARACWIEDMLRTEDGRNCVLVKVAPPVIGQPFGMGSEDITNLVLIPRLNNLIITSKVEHPIPVLIHRILNPTIALNGIIALSKISLSAWGEIYASLEAAENVTRYK